VDGCKIMWMDVKLCGWMDGWVNSMGEGKCNLLVALVSLHQCCSVL